jgi:hypothetical protein
MPRCRPTLSGSARVLLAVLFAVALLAPPSAGAQNYRQLGIYPVFDGWEMLDDGTVEFYFGYMNRHATAITIPLGPDNAFEPAPADQNQPTNFLPGRHEHVFTIRRPGDFDGKMIWTLKSGVGVQKATASKDQLYILEIEEEDAGAHVEPPHITAGNASGKTGLPIALTTQVKATAQKERVIEGSGPRSAALTVAWSLHRAPSTPLGTGPSAPLGTGPSTPLGAAGTVSFDAPPGSTAPAPSAGRGGRAAARPIPGVFTSNCTFPIAPSCGAVRATFSAPGEYVLRAVAQQQREQARAFVHVTVTP